MVPLNANFNAANRITILQTWKTEQGDNATYGSLLACCLRPLIVETCNLDGAVIECLNARAKGIKKLP